MVEKVMFEFIKFGMLLLKEKIFLEKVEKWVVIIFCIGIGKNFYKYLYIFVRVDKNMSCFLLFKWYKMFLDGRNM